MPLRQYWAERAWLGGPEVAAGVLLTVDGAVMASVELAAAPPVGALVLAGVTLPGLANAHSHAFHRALRGRTQGGGGTFWTWREQMYAIAARLTPDLYYELARATFAEMALAGITCVGEFHYVHHDAAGRPYAESNAMGDAVIRAASAAGIRLTLLDTCYLTGGINEALAGPQLRFSDGDADAWADRVCQLKSSEMTQIGAAIHSVRAVPPEQMVFVVDWAIKNEAPLHLHLSEQPGENVECLAVYGASPTQVLDAKGVFGPRTTAVHATHLTAADVAVLGRSGTTVCMCPTTEGDLGDGLGAAAALAAIGSPLSLGSDSNTTIDLFEEARGLERGERLRSGRRGHWTAAQLMTAATVDGHSSLGWPDGGRLVAGGPADFITVRTDTVRLAGDGTLEAIVFAAGAADVREVVIAGRHVVSSGVHLFVDDVPAALASAIAAVTA